MLKIDQVFGTEKQFFDSLISRAVYNVRCCIPGIVQSYDPVKNTVEAQPAIREKMIDENNVESYINLPLLINVPVVFIGSDKYSVKFPIRKNDEVLIFFSDLAIDSFWESGSIQNPIEIRRHDLSDGIAIPCNLSVPKNSIVPEISIVMDENDITFKNSSGSVTLTQIIEHIQDS